MPNPILEQLWKVKDKLAAEAGYDVERFIDNLRRWEAEHPFCGSVVEGAEELRRLVAEQPRKQTETSASMLRDKPPGAG
jgi:hypothetical protein